MAKVKEIDGVPVVKITGEHDLQAAKSLEFSLREMKFCGKPCLAIPFPDREKAEKALAEINNLAWRFAKRDRRTKGRISNKTEMHRSSIM